MAEKILMKNPVVEMDGDEMTRILWDMIKRELLTPYVDLNTEYYDLGLKSRDDKDDEITFDAANAIKKHRVGVKCATITPNEQRVEEYRLKKMWPSPNGTIRAILDGTVFRTPILVNCVKPAVRNWKKPITIARHAYGDVYKAVEYRVPSPGTAELSFLSDDGKTSWKKTVFDYKCPGVLQAQHNHDASIRSFAHSCFRFALEMKQDLWFATKDTISKQYDQTFKKLFDEIFNNDYRQAFSDASITYFYTLIDDAVARVIRSEGGYIWACKNYDGDVMSDMISTVFGSLAMMTSVLVSPDGCFEFEAAHGTVTRHYYRNLKGENTSTNPIATLFAWTGALRKRGELDKSADLCDFADKLESAAIRTIESGLMTQDLAGLCEGITPRVLNSLDFLRAVKESFEQ